MPEQCKRCGRTDGSNGYRLRGDYCDPCITKMDAEADEEANAIF